MAKKKNEKKIPSVLAFEKKIIPSDGLMYSIKWSEKDSSNFRALNLVEKTVRGTISNRLKEGRMSADITTANIQCIDSCALLPDDDTLALKFSLRVISGLGTPCACNIPDFAGKCEKAVKNYIETKGLDELSYRYAYNLANGRFLWRNRVGAENILIKITAKSDNGEVLYKGVFDAKKYSLKKFDKYNEIEEFAKCIKNVLEVANESVLIEIVAYVKIGDSQEVYPSEELIMEKKNGKGEKSKVLYSVDKIAAIHSQKIGNAIRTIDTWYEEEGCPIAVEPYGSVTHLGIAHRSPGNNDFYSLFDKFALGEEIQEDQKNYVIAMLIRGGVFGAASDNS